MRLRGEMGAAPMGDLFETRLPPPDKKAINQHNGVLLMEQVNDLLFVDDPDSKKKTEPRTGAGPKRVGRSHLESALCPKVSLFYIFFYKIPQRRD